MNIVEKYKYALQNIPPPGCGCHVSLMRPANYGVIAGLDSEQIFQDIRTSIPLGNRHVPDKEIDDAIRKALSDHSKGTFTPKPRPKPLVNDGAKALQQIINQGIYSDLADLWEASPIRLLDTPERDMILFLKIRFKLTDYVFIGGHDEPGILGKNIRTVAEWIFYFEAGGKTAPFIIINPLSGKQGRTKTGSLSYRCDDTVKEFRLAMGEFDTLDIVSQIRFWTAVKLPVVALIHTGGKSIHGWLDVSRLAKIKTAEDWQTQIKTRLYDKILTPMGVDRACSNPARLSRLPGHYRAEKEQWQRLLWLSAEGRQVC